MKSEKEKIWKYCNKGTERKDKDCQKEQVDKIQTVLKWAENKEKSARYEGACACIFRCYYFTQIYSGHSLTCPKTFVGQFSSHRGGQTSGTHHEF